jgi:two-component system NarL family response regulator
MTIRIVLADDHRMLRDALVGMLATEADLEVVAVAGDGTSAFDLVGQHVPDVLVVDVGMPDMNGVEVAQRVRACFPTVRILALSGYTDKRFVEEMFKAGAVGYVTKAAAANDLSRAVREVASGKSYLCPEVTGTMLRNLSRTATAISTAPPLSVLTVREREVLKRLADGERSSFIAEHMNIALATVEVHRRNLMRKLDLHTIAELTKYAIREGLSSV